MSRQMKMQMVMTTLILTLAFSLSPAAAAPLTIKQLLDISRVSESDLSPDGKWAAFTLVRNRDLNQPAGGSWKELYLVSTKEGSPRAYVTGEVSVSNPQFSPDGQFLAFRTSRGEKAKAQVWVMPVHGGEAVPMTQSKTGVSAYAWSHDGQYFFTVESEMQNENEKELSENNQLPNLYEENLRGRHLYRTAFRWNRPATEPEILVNDSIVWKVAVDPTGKSIVYSSTKNNLVDDSIMFQDLHVLDLQNGTSRLLVDVPGKLGDVKVSPDGTQVAWTGAATLNDHAISTLFLSSMTADNTRRLTAPDFPGHVRHVGWRDKQTLLVQTNVGTHTQLLEQRLKKDSTKTKILFDGEKNNLVVGMPSFRPGVKNMVMIGHHSSQPSELYLWNGKNDPRRLTFHNNFLAEADLAEQKVITWTARDGLEIEGILQLPLNWNGQPFPLIVDVHGGPESNHHQGWLSRYVSPGHVFCGMGFGVLYPNYRGSTGRGLKFAASSFAEPAGAEFDDIVDGVDHLIAQNMVDADRVGVMGGSYGGYATNWLCTYYSDRFAAGMSFVGVSDLVAKRFLTNIPMEDQYVHMGKPVRESWDLMLKRSPIYYAERCQTPLMILHGDSDPRVHPSQSQEMFRALKMSGHPSVRLIWYPGEGHGNAKRFGRADYVHRTVDWFRWYLLDGKEWDGPMPQLYYSEEMGLPEISE
ncbi:MAG: S9 family peptidase [bacterium]|nr:S9 family peptidase [bacterium]